MTEFLVALAVLLPLFLAVSYAGRYSDIHFTTVQASRYAAMQRAMQPDTSRLSDARLQDQMRARFFVHGARNQGRLRSSDTAANLDGRAATPLWRDMAGNPLVRTPESARLNLASADLAPGGLLAAPVNRMASIVGKNYRGATVAQVEVGNLVNRMDQRTSSPAALAIGTTTAAAGDGLGSSGSAMTRDAAAPLVPTTRMPAVINRVVAAVFSAFEPSAPVFGCIKPDVVPTGRLDRAVPAQGCR
jgi:hypothetical protein